MANTRSKGSKSVDGSSIRAGSIKNSQSARGEPTDVEQPDAQEATCKEHDLANKVVCHTCKKRICHSCALFGNCKGHDVSEQADAKREVTDRAETLMTMYEQMEKEYAKVLRNITYTRYHDGMSGSKKKLKEEASQQF